MARQTTNRGRVAALVLMAWLGGIGSWLLLCRPAPGQEPPPPENKEPELVRLSQNIKGDAKPILLYADEVATWTIGNQRLVLLKGTVLVEQGVVHLRARQAVAWIDLDSWRRSRVQRLELYAEGDVSLENGPKLLRGQRAVVELHTRGDLKLRSQGGKILPQARTPDPIIQRGELVRILGNGTVPASGIQQTSGELTPGQGGPKPRSTPVQGQPSSPGTPPGIRPSSPPVWPPLEPNAATPATPPAPVPRTQPLPPAVPAVPGPAPPPGPQSLGPGGPVPEAAPRVLSIAPRTAAPFHTESFPLPTGEQAIVVTGGVILTVRNVESIGLIDIEADRLVFWTRGNTQQLFDNMRAPEGQSSRDLEFYLAGNVEIRQESKSERRTLRADEVFYDVGRHIAVAVQADLEFQRPGLTDPVHLRAAELRQLSATQFEAEQAEISASRLPSDPGIKVVFARASVEETATPRRSIFGRQFLDSLTGQPVADKQLWVQGEGVFFKVEDVPVFYLPYVAGDARDPLGPLESVRIGQDRVFGTQLYTTFDVYDLLGVSRIPGTRWSLDADYLSRRGPALGTRYDYAGNGLFGVPGPYTGMLKAYGIYDDGTDILGGPRGPLEPHPDWRGRVLWRHLHELPNGFSFQGQLSALSDKNFLEQYYKNEFDTDVNNETFAYLKQQRDNWAWTVLAEPRIRNWVTETEWLPRADGYLLGLSFFDLLTYNLHASAGYAQLKPTEEPPFAFIPTDQRVNTARLDLAQELSLPFSLGPVRLVPYGLVDLTYYSRDLTGDERGRFYGGLGTRGSVPFSRLYPEIQSDLFNVNGIHHKILLSGNYYVAHSDVAFSQLPQLDRLDDDATDQSRRDITPLQPSINPKHGVMLATSPLFNPQLYAIRRLVENRVDTRDTIEVLQMDLRQRWQTKRGFPGHQHIIDWMTLDLSASYFPHPGRDNFGEAFAFLEYDWTWNVGDRTALVSSGWIDPIDDGVRFYSVGAFLNRPDRTSLFVGYRHIDPLESRAITGAVSYVFSPKYALTASSTYDFGVTHGSLTNSLVITRVGSDLQLSLGLTYNALLSNFGVTFEILPNLAAQNRRFAGLPGAGSRLLGR